MTIIYQYKLDLNNIIDFMSVIRQHNFEVADAEIEYETGHISFWLVLRKHFRLGIEHGMLGHYDIRLRLRNLENQ